MADLVVVVAVTNREAKSVAHGISLFLVENGMKGFHKGRKLDKIGLKAQVSHPISIKSALILELVLFIALVLSREPAHVPN